ncbi:MAG: S8 family serine peptidase [Nostocoides sp.]
MISPDRLDPDAPQRRSRAVGDLIPAAFPAAGADPPTDPEEPLSVIVELNVRYPHGSEAAAADFGALWHALVAANVGASHPPSLFRRTQISASLYQCVLTRRTLAVLLELDRPAPGHASVVFRVWPDYVMYPQIDRSAPTVKVDAARTSYNATGAGIVWAVVDTGIDASHPHFSALEVSREGTNEAGNPVTGGLHRDFSQLVQPERGGYVPSGALVDEDGHGTHVAGIISGSCPPGLQPYVASSDEPKDAGYVPRGHVGTLQGMAPKCELVSLKVFRRIDGVAVTSSAAVISALEYLRTKVNLSESSLRVHGVNLSLGCEWDPSHYAAGQSPLCQLIDELVSSGVVVVVSAGNNGTAQATASAKQSVGVLASITEPGHAGSAITVGSTHRDAPTVFGISWTSSKGPTLDGRLKPDVVAPGEWICSAATGVVRTRAGLATTSGPNPDLTYAELSGTSMAAPHVSGLIAGFLSSRPEYIHRPEDVKAKLVDTAMDLGRDRYAQGAGIVDAMRLLSTT